MGMKIKMIHGVTIVAVSLAVLGGLAFAQETNKRTVKALNGLSFSDFKGYEDWQDVAVSETKTSVKAILANPVMIKAYKEGVHENGKHFPEGSKVVKIEWLKKVNTVAPYFVEIPDTLKSLSFIEKDSKKFPESSGWGFAEFIYDRATAQFTAFGKDASFSTTVCYKCHITVKASDYIYTAYPLR
jgi:hypothetical protein